MSALSIKCTCCEGYALPLMVTHDTDLGGPVCNACRIELRAAGAWLKAARIVGCTGPISR